MLIILAVAGGIVLLLIILVIVNYNKLVRLRTKVDESFSTMDIYLVKRWELLPKLVDAVKAYMAHEKGTLEEVVRLRSKDYDSLSEAEKLKTNESLSKHLGGIVAVAEGYPELKSSENFLQLSRDLYQIEDEIAQSRKYYNGCVRMYNTKVETFPGNIFAGLFGFHTRPMFEATAVQRTDVEIQL